MTQSSSDPQISNTAADQDGAAASAGPSPLEQLGQLLKGARESRGLSQESLAGQLNMGLEQLQALESADLNRLPETVFIVAQARRVASQLQLDIDAPIQALRRAVPASSRASDAKPAGPSPSSAASQRPEPARPAERLPKPSAPAAARKPTAQPNRAEAPSGSPLAGLVRLLAWLALLSGLGALGAFGWNQWQQAQRQSGGTLGSTTPAQAPASPAASPAPAAKPRADELVLSTPNDPSWLEVQTLAGDTLFRGTLEGRRSFPIGQGLKVLAGRPDLVLVERSGSAPEPMGTIEDVRPRTYEPLTPPTP